MTRTMRRVLALAKRHGQATPGLAGASSRMVTKCHDLEWIANDGSLTDQGAVALAAGTLSPAQSRTLKQISKLHDPVADDYSLRSRVVERLLDKGMAAKAYDHVGTERLYLTDFGQRAVQCLK